MTTITIIQDYAGLLIGLVLLLAAVSILPGRIKWYVLTAGIAVIGYEGFMRYRNRKLLAEADAERDRLREKVGKMNEKSAELVNTVGQLHQKLVELNSRQQQLQQESEVLNVEGEELSSKRQQWDSESEQLINESNKLVNEIDGHESALSMLDEANNAFAQIERMQLQKELGK